MKRKNEFRTACSMVLTVICLIGLCIMPNKVLCDNKPVVYKTLTVEKTVIIAADQDKQAEKEKLLAEAREEIIIKSLTGYIHPSIVSAEKNHMMKCLKNDFDELLTDLSVVSEKEDGGQYKIVISGKVKKTVLESGIDKCVRAGRVILIAKESKSGKAVNDGITQQSIIEVIKKKDKQLYDYQNMRNPAVNKLIAAAQAGNKAAIMKLGRYYLSDIVIIASAQAEFSEQTMDIYSAHAKGKISIFKVNNRKELLSSNVKHIKGFGSNNEKAVDDALTACAREISAKTAKALSKN